MAVPKLNTFGNPVTHRLWDTALNTPPHKIAILDWINPGLGYCIKYEPLQTSVFGAVDSVKARGLLRQRLCIISVSRAAQHWD